VRRRTAVAMAALAVPALLATSAYATGPAHSASLRPSYIVHHDSARIGKFIPAHAGQTLPRRNATTTSLNWAGWVARPGVVTGVQSTYTVPRAGFGPPGFSASWTGIGGFNTSDLIQAGTTSDSFKFAGLPRYYAWFEILPDSERLLINCTGDRNCTVSPGNRMSIDIHSVGTNLWSVSLVNSGHWSWQMNVHYASSRSSAEWILEAPTVGSQTTVAQVGAAYFGTISNYTTAGHRHTIASGNPIKVNMGAGASVEAVTSNLASNRQSFRVCTYKLTCAAPAH
jgi:hypothetical protein